MPTPPTDPNRKLEELLGRLAMLAEGEQPAESPVRAAAAAAERPAECKSTRQPTRDDELPASPSSSSAAAEPFFPTAPASMEDTHVAQAEIEAIVLRLLMYSGTATGVEISQMIGLPFPMTEKLLHGLKTDRMVVFKSAGTLTDYLYEITDLGLQRARQLAAQCTYCGAVPVSLADYSASVTAQSLGRMRPRIEDLRRAFTDLTISREMFNRLGRAITSGYGLFLHGPPGNGKTSIAERITAAYGAHIWIPRAISVWGEIIRVFDPSCHEELPLAKNERITVSERLDHRWVRIRRPTIVVGGELKMDSLGITTHADTGVCEAPVQMKSNCGTLVIDDFGRQRMPPQQLLNRWIVPLEKRYDFLRMASGRKICVPFDQFIVFSTNLEPRDLVDEAFLRRIPYKVMVEDPSEEQFRVLFEQTCRNRDVGFDAAAFDHLLVQHYHGVHRPMRFCHPRDLVHQIEIFCRCRGLPPTMSEAAVDAAATDYFSVVGA